MEGQRSDPYSMLELYRSALRVRRDEPALGDGPIAWLPAPDGVLSFSRGPGFTCVVNLSGDAAALPDSIAVLVASGPLSDGLLPPDTAIWLRTA
jgi:alpha-glucosidase